jgi:type I restriction enzyme S subunit
MSSKGAGAMRGGIVPTLRFPGFLGEPIHDVQLGDVTEEATTRNGGKLARASVMGVRKEGGIVPMEERLVAGDISRYKIVRSNWFAYNPMRLNIGSIARWQGGDEVLVSPDYVVFRCLARSNPTPLIPAYLDHFRSSRQWEAFTNESGDGGVRIRIYYRDLARMRLLLPDASEQQKIADCLFSIDALIAAEADKLETLKDHKQGLMQQLFPAPGDTNPRLRFPNFQGAKGWEEMPLAQQAELVSGLHLSPTQYDETGEIPYFTGPSDFTNQPSTARKWTEATGSVAVAGDILITVKGSGVGDLWHLTIPQVAMGRQLMAIRAVRCSAAFLHQLLTTKIMRFKSLASGNLIPGLSRGDILGMLLSFPSLAEQQRIGKALTSIDTHIMAQSDRITALKAHKSGLMQQLFPMADEVHS